MECQVEIESASRVRRECARPGPTRRFIRGLAEDAKFGVCRGVIIDLAVDAQFGATRIRMDGAAGRCEIQGDLEIHRKAVSKERGFGATRKLPGGTAGGCGIRGDSKTHRRRGWRSEDSGQPGASSPVSLEDAGFEEARSLASRLDRAMDGSSNLRVHCIEAPEAPVSGVFVCGLHPSLPAH